MVWAAATQVMCSECMLGMWCVLLLGMGLLDGLLSSASVACDGNMQLTIHQPSYQPSYQPHSDKLHHHMRCLHLVPTIRPDCTFNLDSNPGKNLGSVKTSLLARCAPRSDALSTHSINAAVSKCHQPLDASRITLNRTSSLFPSFLQNGKK